MSGIAMSVAHSPSQQSDLRLKSTTLSAHRSSPIANLSQRVLQPVRAPWCVVPRRTPRWPAPTQGLSARFVSTQTTFCENGSKAPSFGTFYAADFRELAEGVVHSIDRVGGAGDLAGLQTTPEAKRYERETVGCTVPPPWVTCLVCWYVAGLPHICIPATRHRVGQPSRTSLQNPYNVLVPGSSPESPEGRGVC